MADTVHTWSPKLQRDRLQGGLLGSSAARSLHQVLRRRSSVALLMCLPLILIIALQLILMLPVRWLEGAVLMLFR